MTYHLCLQQTFPEGSFIFPDEKNVTFAQEPIARKKDSWDSISCLSPKQCLSPYVKFHFRYQKKKPCTEPPNLEPACSMAVGGGVSPPRGARRSSPHPASASSREDHSQVQSCREDEMRSRAGKRFARKQSRSQAGVVLLLAQRVFVEPGWSWRQVSSHGSYSSNQRACLGARPSPGLLGRSL